MLFTTQMVQFSGWILNAIPTAARPAFIVTEWLDDILPAAKEVAWEPTVGARFFAITETAIYETWAAYDRTAVGPVHGVTLKTQGGAANEANKREAISAAVYTVLSTLAPQRRRALDGRMTELGYDPNATSKPAELGRRAAHAMLAKFHDDGASEAGDFADTIGYAPRGPELADAWQPIDLLGKRQLPTTPQWSRVTPFALTRADEFRPVPPPEPGSAEIGGAKVLVSALSARRIWPTLGGSPRYYEPSLIGHS